MKLIIKENLYELRWHVKLSSTPYKTYHPSLSTHNKDIIHHDKFIIQP